MNTVHFDSVVSWRVPVHRVFIRWIHVVDRANTYLCCKLQSITAIAINQIPISVIPVRSHSELLFSSIGWIGPTFNGEFDDCVTCYIA